MWKQFAKRYLPFWVAYIALGWWVGTKLIAIQDLQAFKVLNLLGLFADLCGVLILSRLVLHNPRLQAFVVGPIAENLYMLFFMGVVGVLLRAELGAAGPSSRQLESLSLGLFMYVVAPIAANLPAVTEKLIPKLGWSEERKASALGGTLLVFGILIQLGAAYLDLHSK
jgi:hypothetical protein